MFNNLISKNNNNFTIWKKYWLKYSGNSDTEVISKLLTSDNVKSDW